MHSTAAESGRLTVHSRLCQYHRPTQQILGIRDACWQVAHVHVDRNQLCIEPADSAFSTTAGNTATFVFNEKHLGIRLEFLQPHATDGTDRNTRCLVQPESAAEMRGVPNGATLVAVDGFSARGLSAGEVKQLFERERPIVIEVAQESEMSPVWPALRPAVEASYAAIGVHKLDASCTLLLSRAEPRLMSVILQSGRLLLLYASDGADALRWQTVISRLIADTEPRSSLSSAQSPVQSHQPISAMHGPCHRPTVHLPPNDHRPIVHLPTHGQHRPTTIHL